MVNIWNLINLNVPLAEMSEFATNGSGHHGGSAGGGSATGGTYNKNGGLKAVTPPQYAYGNAGYPHASASAD